MLGAYQETIELNPISKPLWTPIFSFWAVGKSIPMYIKKYISLNAISSRPRRSSQNTIVCSKKTQKKHLNNIISSTFKATLLNRWIFRWVELQWKGSSPAACTAALYSHKGWTNKKRLPKTLKCSKSKMWRPRKLKLHQPDYLIR